MLLWNIQQQQQQQQVGGLPPQASQTGDDAPPAEAVDGIVATAGGDQVLGLGEGKRKRESAGGSGADAKKAKKSEMFEPSTERLVFWNKPLPPLSAVKELVCEGEKLRSKTRPPLPLQLVARGRGGKIHSGHNTLTT
jgi:hypothetical protein